MNWLDYREKLGIGLHDEAKMKYFIRKIFNSLNSVTDTMTPKDYLQFCDYTGESCDESRLDPVFGDYLYESCVQNIANRSQSIEMFLWYYLAFAHVRKVSSGYFWHKENLIELLKDKLEESNIPYDILVVDDYTLVFPKGAKELDDALISEPLEWLNEYPDARRSFIKALKAYYDATDETASETADQFRKALESFLQTFFSSGKSLENLNKGNANEKASKSDYAKYLASQGVPGELANDIANNLQSYTNFMNNYAKHHDKTSRKVLEYLMYQTGTIIRLLITLKREEASHAD